jgi:hypothetical protein
MIKKQPQQNRTNPTMIVDVCSRLVSAFHWQSVGSKMTDICDNENPINMPKPLEPQSGNNAPSPRLITREQAARYCNLSPQGFSDWVTRELLPPAISGTTRWDLKAIDAALDALSGISNSFS